MRRSVKFALVSVFAATHAVLYLASFGLPLWRNWAIYLEPIEGIVLGPWAGLSAALVGGIIGRTIMPDPLWMFGIVAEPLGVLAVGFLVQGRWRPVALLYGVMLTAYFAHPLGRWLPYWTILDVWLALGLTYPVAKLSKNLSERVGRMPIVIPLSFVGTATDALTRIFLLIPLGLYSTVFGWSYAQVYGVFVPAAISSYVEDASVVIISFLVGAPLLLALRRIPGFKYP